MRTRSTLLARGVLGIAAIAAPLVFSGGAAAATGLTTLHYFGGGPDGAEPHFGVTIDTLGNIFGTSNEGGQYDYGTLWELSPMGGGAYTESVVHSFGPYEYIPTGVPAVTRNGYLWVTTEGGTLNDGTIAEFTPGYYGYQESQVYTFDGTKGIAPSGGLLEHGKTFYATTSSGGKYGYGTIVNVTENLTVNDVYDFTFAGGAYPYSNLVEAGGAYYGTTIGGGLYNMGTVFRFVPAKHGQGSVQTLWSFAGAPDGASPGAGVIVDPQGNIWGTTTYGGDTGGYYGDGVVFKLTPTPSGYAETIVHRFSNSPDGSYPSGGLTFFGRYIYGTTGLGGATYGTIFRFAKTGTNYNVVYAFQGTNGANPWGSLFAKGKALYGTTGGGLGGILGTVFEFVP